MTGPRLAAPMFVNVDTKSIVRTPWRTSDGDMTGGTIRALANASGIWFISSGHPDGQWLVRGQLTFDNDGLPALVALTVIAKGADGLVNMAGDSRVVFSDNRGIASSAAPDRRIPTAPNLVALAQAQGAPSDSLIWASTRGLQSPQQVIVYHMTKDGTVGKLAETTAAVQIYSVCADPASPSTSVFGGSEFGAGTFYKLSYAAGDIHVAISNIPRSRVGPSGCAVLSGEDGRPTP